MLGHYCSITLSSQHAKLLRADPKHAGLSHCAYQSLEHEILTVRTIGGCAAATDLGAGGSKVRLKTGESECQLD